MKNEVTGRVEVLRDRYYTAARDPRQSYDLAVPAGVSGSAGLILCIHGGGWVEGSKASYADALLQVCGERGIAAAALNYRYVSASVGFEDQLDDISAALADIKATGAGYGVCFDRCLLTGISAGGHLSLLYAYTRRETSPVRPVCVVELCGPTDLAHPFYYSAENSVTRAVGPEYFRNIISRGVKHDIRPDDLAAAKNALDKYSPVNYVDGGSVPTVFGHGERDDIVPYGNAAELDRRLTESGVEHTFVSFPDSGHGCEDGASMKRMMELFFAYAERFLK